LKASLTFFIFFFGIICGSHSIHAQVIKGEPTDDLGNVSDAFQETFFEALKQKAIENYELALTALKKAEVAAKKDPENLAVVYFETGKNFKFLKRYPEAEEYFLRVLDWQNDRLEVMEELYDLYYLQRNYDKAIPLVKKLIVVDEDYKEDLANLYSRTEQYEKALSLLDDLDESWGESAYRNALRQRIYKATGNRERAIDNLQSRIDKNPKKEQDYLNLIYLYSELGEAKKAFDTAKELLKNKPDSELAHLALYKFYLDEGDITSAMKSMNVVFGSTLIKNDNKYKVLSDFLNYVGENPQYENELDKVIAPFSREDNGQVYEQLGSFYLAKGDKTSAMRFYERGVAMDPDNFSLLKHTVLLQIEARKFEAAAKLSEDALATFPAQALLYLLNGVSNNGLEKPDNAIESLEMGLDFVLDDPKMERDFYDQLQKAYSLKGNSKKANEYARKMAQLNIPN
jgi:tetratricopeptide (TPR) repeat protein